MAFIDNFKDRWIGKRVDVDNFPAGEIYQCVDLIKRYMQELYKIPNGAYGNAIDYWRNTAGVVNMHFDKITDQQPKAGDIAVLNGNAGNSLGHIGIATGRVQGSSFEILEQNGSTARGQGTGNDAIRLRYVGKLRIAGLLRPKGQVNKAKGKAGVIRPYTWYVRATPGGKIIGVARQGQVYEILGDLNGWRKIRFNGHTGYVGSKAWA